MLLAIDIGNTNITVGVFKGTQLDATWRLATDSNRLTDEYGILLNNLLPMKEISPSQITKACICCVVPPLLPVFEELCKTYFNINPLIVGSGTKTGIRILYDNPHDVGADRIVDAAAALKIYGGPVIVVDFGTGTVFDAIEKNGDYLGGAIAPGINISAEALVSKSSILRGIELIAPPKAIGKNTIHAMQSGLILGCASMVEGMVSRFIEELGGDVKVVATGGLASKMNAVTDIFDFVNPNLTLIGLQHIYELNVKT